MTDLIAFLILAGSITTYVVTLRAGIYRRIPFEHYALMGVASCLALYGVITSLSWTSIAVFSLAFSSLVLLAWYVHFGAILPRSQIRLELGQRFPSFTLPASDGEIFESEAMRGKQSALYLFYRGHW
jgi:hypothetical protein